MAVRLEDQQHINAFGRLNGRMHDLEDDLKAKQSKHELLDDAQNELILADDDEIVRCGPLRAAHAIRFAPRVGLALPLQEAVLAAPITLCVCVCVCAYARARVCVCV